jgi:uroporphyrinogen-III synthase
MIPLLVPPLAGLQVLVTRPAAQAEALCQRVVNLGGDVLRLPVLTIEPRAVTPPSTAYELLIFISTNAVQHGQAVLAAQPQARIAAVGAATALALQNLGHAIDITPEHAASSEALLAHPMLQRPPANVLILRGSGGRELLRDTLSARGSRVDVVEVYERIAAVPIAEQYQALQLQLQNGDLDIISVTSVEILRVLDALLDTETRELAHTCTLLAGSARIAKVARESGWCGEFIVADSPEDTALINALTRWYTRARS